MSQKINFGTINTESMEKLSAFHVAHLELRSWNEWKKTELAKIDEEMAKIKESRKKAIEEGMSTDDAIRTYSLEECLAKQTSILAKYDEETKPHKDAQKDALFILSTNLYYAYVLAMRKGDLSAKGTLVLKKSKKTVEVNVEKSFKGYIKDFVDTIGCSNTENVSAMDKFAQTMSIRNSGNRVLSKGEDYVGEKSESQFNKLFMYNFLQYVIIEKKVVVVNDDGTLSMRVFETSEN